jgi:hypothetical protein
VSLGQLGWRGPADSGPAMAHAGGARVRTVAGGAGLLTSRAQMAVGGRGGERCGRVWAGWGRKWSGPSPYEQ